SAAVIVAVLGSMTYARNALYRSAGSMWLDVTKKRPDNSRAHYNLANHYTRQEKHEKAIDSYKTAIRLQADHAEAHCGLASVFRKLARHEQAIRHYKLAIKHREMLWIPGNLAKTYSSLAIVYGQLKRLDEAADCYRRAIETQPNYANAQYNLGNILYKLGRYDEAIRYYEMAIENRGTLESREDLAKVYNNLAHIHARLNQLDRAAIYYRRTIEIDPDNYSAMNNLAWMLSTHRDDEIRNGPEALELAKMVCAATNYSQPVYLDTLAAAYAETGQFDKAVKTARRALLLASESRDKKLIKELTTKLKLYEQHKPLRR
ncbi:MAG: tetratricopeptide repeat protein, partial [Phycisphaerae bacterium]|nr:tetratricopeptide repeat protein [Phycisphaerae bacterium]